MLWKIKLGKGAKGETGAFHSFMFLQCDFGVASFLHKISTVS